MQLPKIKSASIIQALARAHKSGNAAVILGSPAIGKSAVVKEYARLAGLKLFELRLSTRSPAEIALPVPNREKGVTEFLSPASMPKESDGPSMLFLDEITAAPKMVQAMAYQLLDVDNADRGIADYKLPKDCFVVGAGNLSTDNAVTYDISTALLSRITWLHMVPDFADWLKWGVRSKEIDFSILGFLKNNPDLFDTFDPKSRNPFCSPRTWHKLAGYMATYESREQAADDETFMALAAGTVGHAVAIEFTAYLKLFAKIPPIDVIIDSPNTAPVPDDRGVLFAVICGLAANATPENFESVTTYASRLDKEFGHACIKMAVERTPEVAHTTAYIKFKV